mgnify:CR=1 FL=1
MSNFSVEKLKNKKKEKCLTNRKISEQSGIPLVTIDKLFSGANTNPTVNILQKITTVLECTMDDLMDYEGSPMQDYYQHQEIFKLAQEIYDNKKLNTLISITKNLDDTAINAIIEISKLIKNKNE